MLVPAISEVEWHPFSMSSAYGDLEASGYVSVHIRVQEPGSWTYRLKEYFRIIAGEVGGNSEDPFIANNLYHYDAAGEKQKGLNNGPDGLPLLRIDGPYASPTQVYSNYRDIILVGSGIGLTPSASILRSVLRHKWKKGYYPETIRFCWILRQNELDSFHWFIELLADLSARVQSDRESGALTELHYVELNIYVTGSKDLSSNRSNAHTPTGNAPGTLDRKTKKSAQQPGFSSANAIDPNTLRRMLLNPSVDAKDQGEVQMDGHRAPNRIQDIWVWRGRPEWNTIFANTEAHILRRREAQGTVYETIKVRVESEVGVCFCGAPAIGNALKKNCVSYSKKHEEIKFTLNAEVF
uniref:Ferric reductase NAD binding domain-containing protein n=1 Tax=Aplanochytrium stocchinoi TaxID=215587 RepID=A0A7S3LKL7_9STRA